MKYQLPAPAKPFSESATVPCTWHCICGAVFPDGHSAFLHRDGTQFHSLTPVPLAADTQHITDVELFGRLLQSGASPERIGCA